MPADAVSVAYQASTKVGRVVASIAFALWSCAAVLIFIVGLRQFDPRKYRETSVQVEDTCDKHSCRVKDTNSDRRGVLSGPVGNKPPGAIVAVTYRSDDESSTTFYITTNAERKTMFLLCVVGVPLLWLCSAGLLALVFVSRRVAAAVALLWVFT